MFSLRIYLLALAALLIITTVTWLISIPKRNVAIIDAVWPLLFLTAGWVYVLMARAEGGPLPVRVPLMLGMLTLWSLRLASHIGWRNFGHGEDRRYQAIRARNQPNFAFKSLYLVFSLQALLAWIISLPLLGSALGAAPLSGFDFLGAALWLVGLVFEAGGDWQLMRFKANPNNAGRVMDQGLWRFTRHPNYFGDFCIWWGLYLVAVAAGAWWSVLGPALMSVLLMRVSGVTLLEKDIKERRPAYASYIARTNAFFPGKPKES